MTGYSYVVFDVDGTLADTERSVLSSLKQLILEVKGEDVSLDDLTFALGITGADALDRLDIDAGAIERWTELAGERKHLIEAFPGVFELLDALKAADKQLGIVSSRARGEYADEIAPLGLDPYFGQIVLAEDTARHKPEPDPLEEYLRRVGADPAEAIYIGDSVYDRRCAAAAGVDFALASWGAVNPVEDPTYVLEEPRDLCRIVGIA